MANFAIIDKSIRTTKESNSYSWFATGFQTVSAETWLEAVQHRAGLYPYMVPLGVFTALLCLD